MPVNHPYLIYNASAGSGKTYTLVKAYLTILLKASSTMAFKNILAITFTNKAADEMKTRIIDALKDFSSEEILIESNTMFEDLCGELDMSAVDLNAKSNLILDAIMHNYAAFDISTIDGFTHRLIRTFAHDLKLPLNFEVALDVEALLNEAVDRLISKAGTDKRLTKTLVDFAIEKADDDKSWDVSRDFYAISKLLVKENDRPFIEELQDKTLDDFKALKSTLRQEIKTNEQLCLDSANIALEFIRDNGLEFGNFTRASIPNYFKKITENNYNQNVDTVNWPSDLIDGNTIYPKSKTDAATAATIESIQPQIAEFFIATKTAVLNFKLLKAIYKNLTPLSVLSAINSELQIIKDEQNVMLISEFNGLISQEIKNQPTPFIYERIGEKFKHYFIDEFQDTSELQWQNLTPLLDNAIASKPGSMMLVGDAKQAIYRWRGGKAEQFIDLYNKTENPFHLEPEIIPLEWNYRSFREVINFNNGFFNYLSDTIFSHPDHSDLYKNATQLIKKEESGYVQLEFLDLKEVDDKALAYSEEVYNTIKSCLENGYEEADICVLVRKKKEGVAIANYLSEKGLNLMSSETLLLNNSENVQFVNNILRLLLQPENQETKAEILLHIAQLCQIEDKHSFLKTHINLDISALFDQFEALDYFIDYTSLIQLSFYDLVETVIRQFKLVKHSDAFIQYYMDVVLEFSEKQLADIGSFLHYFDSKNESLSIVTPEGYQAIQILTVHKSKGLEFPVVIFPFADLDIYREITPQEWFPINPETFHGFSHTLLNYSKTFESYGDAGQEIFNRHESELELDNVNILYVALTRAVEQLYVISKLDISSKGIVNQKSYAGFLISYLQQIGKWDNDQLVYQFGESAKQSETKSKETSTIIRNTFISTPKEAHNIKVITRSASLWDTIQEKAIEKGNLIHDIMAMITTEADVNDVMLSFLENGTINKVQEPILKETILQIIRHPQLQLYFQEQNITVYNERDIISNTGSILRPDRLVIMNENDAIIIDYKSGKEQSKHLEQLESYEAILKVMKFHVAKKILIYINDSITIKEF
ncbi:DNA helicase UvrD [Bizionia argentinensis JUB59]|uniref:DNA 3'-5' helicase n=1 Tax=Bizionia argentinensis JUB59 TaxID=1046627 RepID=G2EEM3_9FLAO|nr:UvrD-helicase domain-containing protein [Bizionia argentinensis]EGV43128.1 DNA helicase UvrD [Bizionia argentinensis JUB59]